MNLSIDRIVLHAFKGLHQENLLFNNSNVIVSGANGTGKSSVMCAWYWLMADCSESLVSNPAIFPLNIEECTPSVEVVASVDGKQMTLERQVKRTVKKSKVIGQADSVSFSSTYFVNSVEYGLRDFKKKLEEYGITDKFLTLSHPDVFLSGKKDEMRKILFGMVSDVTDLQIAQQMDGVSEATELLKNYTFEEAQSMQKASLRKIREIYGKDGELLRARISGLEEAKVDIDFSALELQKNMLKEQVEKNQDAQRTASTINFELDELRKKDMSLQFELSTILQKEKDEKKALEDRIYIKRKELQEKANLLNRDIKRTQDEVELYETSIKRYEAADKNLKENYKQAQGLSFDENSLMCPTCGQLLQFDKQETIRADFEKQKKIKIEQAEIAIKENASLLAIKKSELADLNKKLEKMMEDKATTETVLKQPINAFDGAMEEPNPYADKKAELEKQISEIQKTIEDKKATMPNVSSLKAEELFLQGELRECEIQLSKADTNSRIDSQIEELQRQQIEFEQNIANNEKVLYQLDLILRRKHEVLSDSINKHFKLVKWQFWDHLKNGEIRDTVIAKVDGKPFDSSLNTAMQIRAKLDIIQGLQNFYKEYYPVMLDSSEMLDSNSLSLIDMPCQMVYLKVGENKELSVKCL